MVSGRGCVCLYIACSSDMCVLVVSVGAVAWWDTQSQPTLGLTSIDTTVDPTAKETQQTSRSSSAQVSEHWPANTGQRTPANEHRPTNTGQRIPPARKRIDWRQWLDFIISDRHANMRSGMCHLITGHFGLLTFDSWLFSSDFWLFSSRAVWLTAHCQWQCQWTYTHSGIVANCLNAPATCHWSLAQQWMNNVCAPLLWPFAVHSTLWLIKCNEAMGFIAFIGVTFQLSSNWLSCQQQQQQ